MNVTVSPEGAEVKAAVAGVHEESATVTFMQLVSELHELVVVRHTL